MPLSLREPELLRTFFHVYSGCLLMRSIFKLGTWGRHMSDAIYYVIFCTGLRGNKGADPRIPDVVKVDWPN